jgi:hypothetical protein
MYPKKLMTLALGTALIVGTTAAWSSNESLSTANESAAVGNAKSDASATQDTELVRLSNDAALTMRDVRGARLALFNGDIDRAQVYIDAAVARVASAVDEANQYAVNKDAKDADDLLIPFDAGFAIAETLERQSTASSAQGDQTASAAGKNASTEAIAQANQHLKDGNSNQAMDDLKETEFDVLLSASMVPIKFARQAIDEASSAMKDAHYYEAGLALKRIEDAVLIDTVVLASPGQSDAAAAS